MANLDQYPDHMRRDMAARYLADCGVPRKPATLAKLAVKGGGPRFCKAGARTCVYSRADLDAWVASILTGPVTTTSEAA